MLAEWQLRKKDNGKGTKKPTTGAAPSLSVLGWLPAWSTVMTCGQWTYFQIWLFISQKCHEGKCDSNTPVYTPALKNLSGASFLKVWPELSGFIWTAVQFGSCNGPNFASAISRYNLKEGKGIFTVTWPVHSLCLLWNIILENPQHFIAKKIK